MSRDWTKEELHTASELMKQNGHMGFEELLDFYTAKYKLEPVGDENEVQAVNLRQDLRNMGMFALIMRSGAEV